MADEIKALTTVLFQGVELIAADGDAPETTIVAMKPMVEGMGLRWQPQLAKLRAHPVLSKGITIIVVPTPGGPQEMIGLPLSMIPGWMTTVNANKVVAPLRPNITLWQEKAFDVLYRAVFGDLRTKPLDYLIRFPENLEGCHPAGAGLSMSQG